MQELVTTSFQHNYQNEFRDLVGLTPLCSQQLEECGSENVVRVTLVNPSFQQSLTRAIEKIIEAKLQLDRFGFTLSETSATSGIEEKRLSDKLTILINDITIAMKKLNYASYRGKVYKREPRSRYTYSFKCDARAFINTLATNEQFKSRLVREMKKIIEMLSDPLCELFEPLVIDYDLIEVNNGVCWSLQTRAFVESPIEENQIGKISPRAFSAYDSNKEADPKYFREILENSLSQSEVSTFCEDYLKLLNYNKKQHKDRVPCLVGDANSGKTSLFFPIQGLVHHGNIATVTKQRAFNKAMISPFTEVIFIDEADENTLDISDWKLLTQGGYAAHDVKYQTARAFINKCPMLITAQHKLQFGTVHQPAMDKRLRTYHFKRLTNPKKKAVAWLRKHPMECVVWATEQAKRRTVDTESDDTDSDDENDAQNEGSLQQKEKEDLRALSLTDPPVEEAKSGEAEASEDECSTAGTEQSDADGVNDSTSIDVLDELRATLRKSDPESLRYRQVEHMLQEQEQQRASRKNFAEKQHQLRKTSLRERGVSTQTADLLPSDPDVVMPTPILMELQSHCDQQRAQEERDRRENARQAFEGAWLRNTEIELHECVEKLHFAQDRSFRRNMLAYLEVLCDKLKTHHSNLGTLNKQEAVQERRRVCVTLGLLSAQDQHLVTRVDEPLPRKKEVQAGTSSQRPNCNDGAFSSDDESYFITPEPSSSMGLSALQPDDCAISDELLRTCTSRKRKHGPSQKGAKKAMNTILNYCTIQK